MGQKFVARQKFEYSNGAVGWRPGGPMDCLGPFSKVQNCPVEGIEKRYTCYATGYPESYFSVPACTRINGKHVRGYFGVDGDNGIIFHPIKGGE